MNTQTTVYTRYEDVPSMRRASSNIALLVIGFIFSPIIYWYPCYNVISGPVYTNKPDGRGGLATWGPKKVYLAILLMLANIAATIILVTI